MTPGESTDRGEVRAEARTSLSSEEARQQSRTRPRGKFAFDEKVAVAPPTVVSAPGGKRLIKVTSAQVSAARARVEADRLLGHKTPDWIVRVSKLSPRKPRG